jgi:transposase, IS5 family
MAERKKAPRLGDYFLGKRKFKPTFLDEIDQIIDWQPIKSFLNKKIKRKANAIGNPAYPALPMFKVLLLQRWYNLSDPATEQALMDRFSFIRFTGFSIEDDVPDETTICRFRNGLITLNVLDKLLDMINGQIGKKGLLVREGAVVDASVVESQRKPRKVIDIMPEDRAEESDESDEAPQDDPSVTISYSDDEDAAWLWKRRRAYYGYKIHVATDSRDGFVLGGHVTPANHSDTGELERLVDSVRLRKGAYVFADKGYTSARNRDVLYDRKLKDGIMDRATRSGPLNRIEQTRNRLISGVRPLVERAFGTLKRGYGFARARYIGIEKVEAELKLIAMAFNLKKAVRLARP